MNAIIKTMLIKILKDIQHKIETDTCGLDEEELISVMNILTNWIVMVVLLFAGTIFPELIFN